MQRIAVSGRWVVSVWIMDALSLLLCCLELSKGKNSSAGGYAVHFGEFPQLRMRIPGVRTHQKSETIFSCAPPNPSAGPVSFRWCGAESPGVHNKVVGYFSPPARLRPPSAVRLWITPISNADFRCPNPSLSFGNVFDGGARLASRGAEPFQSGSPHPVLVSAPT